MKIRTLLVVLGIVTCFTSARILKKADFSGIWTINLDKSDFGKLDANLNSAKLIVIDQKSKSLILTRTFGNNAPSIEYYNFDGTSVDTTMGEYKKTSFLKWADDEMQFTISSLYNVTQQNRDPWKYTRTETYSLSEGDKILTVDRVSVLPDRKETIKVVYDKK